MNERYRTISAVMLMLLRNNKSEVLLQKRQNTGYMDGYWDLGAAGHVEKDESMKQAIIREAKEEIGVEISIEDVHFATLAHKHTSNSGVNYYNGYFFCENYVNEPEIMEVDKASEMEWFLLDNLPDNVITDRLIAIEHFLSMNPYHEIGWEI